MNDEPRFPGAGTTASADNEIVSTLFDLGRQVASVLDLDELLQQIPTLIARLINFDAFAVYLVDERRNELKLAYSVGYPQTPEQVKLKLNQGLVGAAVAAETPILVNDLKSGARGKGGVALWIGPGTIAHFRNLTITPASDAK